MAKNEEKNSMVEMNEMNDVMETSNNPIESEKTVSKETAGRAVAYVAGVVTPFVVMLLVKGVKWVVNKRKSKKAVKAEADVDEFPEFDEEEVA